MMNGGAGGKVVMRLLGNKKLSTTERYVHTSDEHCRSVVDRLLPG
jgi:site-specific recombinase XerD